MSSSLTGIVAVSCNQTCHVPLAWLEAIHQIPAREMEYSWEKVWFCSMASSIPYLLVDSLIVIVKESWQWPTRPCLICATSPSYLLNSSALSPTTISFTPDQAFWTSYLSSDVIRNAPYPRTFALADLSAWNTYSLRYMHSALSHFLQLFLYMSSLTEVFLTLLFKITVGLLLVIFLLFLVSWFFCYRW